MVYETGDNTGPDHRLTDDERSRLRAALALLPLHQRTVHSHGIVVGRPDTLLVRVKSMDFQNRERRTLMGQVAINIGGQPPLAADSVPDKNRHKPGFALARIRRTQVIRAVLRLTEENQDRPDTLWLYDACAALLDSDADRIHTVSRLITSYPTEYGEPTTQTSQMRSGLHGFKNGSCITTTMVVPYGETGAVSPVDAPVSAAVRVSDGREVYTYVREEDGTEVLGPDVGSQDLTVTNMVAAIHTAVQSGIRTLPQAD